MSEPLLPCPFCGGSELETGSFVQCMACNGFGPQTDLPVSWNTRHPSAPDPEFVQAMATELASQRHEADALRNRAWELSGELNRVRQILSEEVGAITKERDAALKQVAALKRVVAAARPVAESGFPTGPQWSALEKALAALDKTHKRPMRQGGKTSPNANARPSPESSANA